MSKHTIRYIDLHPQPVKTERQWPWAVGCVIVFAAIGVMLAWRG